MKENTDEPESASPAPLIQAYGHIPRVLKNVCVCVCVCVFVCEDAQLQDTQLETMFLHMLLTVSVHDMICVTSCFVPVAHY